MSLHARMVGYNSSISTITALSRIEEPYRNSKSHSTTKI